MRIWLAVLPLIAAALGCGGDQGGGGGYLIYLHLQGSPQAFADRAISVEGKAFSPPGAVDPATGWQTASTSLCTVSHDMFLNQSLHVVVTSAKDHSVITDVEVSRFACKFSRSEYPNGYWEGDTWFIDDDGTIEANTMDLTKTGSSCGSGTSSGGYLCPQPEF